MGSSPTFGTQCFTLRNTQIDNGGLIQETGDDYRYDYRQELIMTDNEILSCLDNPSPAFLADACMWDSHDFGLLDDSDRQRRVREMRHCAKALFKALTRGGMYQNAANGQAQETAQAFPTEPSF